MGGETLLGEQGSRGASLSSKTAGRNEGRPCEAKQGTPACSSRSALGLAVGGKRARLPPNTFRRASATLCSQAPPQQPTAHTRGVSRRHPMGKQKRAEVLQRIWAGRQHPDSSEKQSSSAPRCTYPVWISLGVVLTETAQSLLLCSFPWQEWALFGDISTGIFKITFCLWIKPVRSPQSEESIT